MAIPSFHEGSELASGRYRLERRLGSGGMATVWLAHDGRLARSVAIKLPTEALSADETFARRFEREAQTAAALSHPHLVSVYDYGCEGERPYLVSEYIDGSTLAELRERGRPPETEHLARTLLEALAHIHAAGIVHRDVKPGNVLVDDAGKILLTDFGIAQSTEETSLTATGHVIGTLSYIAPEVKCGDRAGPASDLYSLGVVVTEQLSAEDPDRVARLADALTAEDPAARPASAERALEMLERRPVVVEHTAPMAVESAAAPEPTATQRRTRPLPPPPLPSPTSPGPERRSRTPWIAGALMVALVAAIVAIAITGSGGDSNAGAGRNGGAAGKKAGGSKASSSTDTTQSTTAPSTTAATTTSPTAGIDPARGTELNNQGFALLQQGDVEGALPKLQQAVASFPEDSTDMNYAFALFNYAQALRLSGDPAAAIPLLERRLSFSDFKRDVVEAELATAQAAAGGESPPEGKPPKEEKPPKE